eukprot:CAMPEP_0116897478 /NCGR_PEP_ID=MMETSP0467-20121206/6442_1 /TAXON_ID=283647 /ORGANISM="Mesodinium pulex, Strain SPMC105" /LENGTH=62 /DNA_ID=CAMNT_0004569129 /DNA_START=448 /DNA_END=636 /DNA_ORIENTATION=-
MVMLGFKFWNRDALFNYYDMKIGISNYYFKYDTKSKKIFTPVTICIFVGVVLLLNGLYFLIK